MADSLHPGGGVDGVPEQAVAGQSVAHHAGNHRPAVDACGGYNSYLLIGTLHNFKIFTKKITIKPLISLV